MSESANVGSINIHCVTKDNVKCIVKQHDNFTSITLDFGLSSVTLYTTLDDVAAIRRIMGGW
jgi:hypothetical protein